MLTILYIIIYIFTYIQVIALYFYVSLHNIKLGLTTYSICKVLYTWHVWKWMSVALTRQHCVFQYDICIELRLLIYCHMLCTGKLEFHIEKLFIMNVLWKYRLWYTFLICETDVAGLIKYSSTASLTYA